MSSSCGYKLINALSQQLDVDMSVDGTDGTMWSLRVPALNWHVELIVRAKEKSRFDYKNKAKVKR